jgi:hypothetical protein
MSTSKKRQAEDELPAPKPKKSKKKKSKKHQAVEEALDTELGVNTLFSRMDNQLLADYLAQKTTRFGTDLSTIELSDLTISGKSQLPHATFSHSHSPTRVSRTRAACSLLSFLSRAHPRHKLVAGGQDLKQPSFLPREVCTQTRGPCQAA